LARFRKFSRINSLLGVDLPCFWQNLDITGVKWKFLKINGLNAGFWASSGQAFIARLLVIGAWL
jgi:hypothetical protein